MKRKVPAALAESILAKVPFQVSFWLCTNENLRSLVDVSNALQNASERLKIMDARSSDSEIAAWLS